MTFLFYFYRREGLEWADIDWVDNGECLDLIEKVNTQEHNWLTRITNLLNFYDHPNHFQFHFLLSIHFHKSLALNLSLCQRLFCF